ELPQRIFEVGEVVISGKNVQKLAGVSVHSQANFTEILSIVDAIMRERAIEYEVKESDDGAFIEGRRAEIIVGGSAVGTFGEVSPDVISNFGMANPMVAFEMVL
ncbi:MAG: phenylalanine--tRNA ligase subunit beta, partial [Methanosarcinales archaeon]|nr:phenylalanine--tRNA ligase subunit beta [Methanosarcinales archaeon]